MPTKEQLESALMNAHKAGDTAAATQLANALKGGAYDKPQEVTVEPELQPMKLTSDLDQEVLQGLTFGFADEIEAGMAATLAKFLDGHDFDTAYNDIVTDIRAKRDKFTSEHPALSTAAQVVGGVASGGAGIAKAASKLAPAGSGAAQRIAAGSGTGAIEGAIAGAGTADGEDMIESAKQGALLGAGLGFAGGTMAHGFAKRSEFKDELAELFKSDPQNTKLAKYMQTGAGKLAKDKIATETIRQGYDEGVVAAIKGSSGADKAKMRKMLSILERGKGNARFAALNRPSDVVGDSIKQRLRYVQKVNRQAGMKIKAASEGLKGKSVDFEPAVMEFLGELDEVGVKFNPLKGSVSFTGSDFEKIPGAERAIKNILNRMRNTNPPDAYDVHRLKKFIDNHVEFGKTSDGSVGQAERILKKLRHNMDAALDGKFKAYDAANSTFAQTKGALDDIQKAAGTSIDFNSENLDKSLGVLSRRLMSNVQSRGQLLDSIKVLDDVTAANGATFNDDIVTQALFADELNSVFGASAKTSLQGELEKGLKAGARAATGDHVGAGLSYVSKKWNDIKGVNQEQQIKTMKALLAR